jgi:hypothetical protein
MGVFVVDTIRPHLTGHKEAPNSDSESGSRVLVVPFTYYLPV